jgi:bifunctional DNA-binding transcriptional regulator/antitoxin component of YhaV-PrlF toxin-antitoxin module
MKEQEPPAGFHWLIPGGKELLQRVLADLKIQKDPAILLKLMKIENSQKDMFTSNLISYKELSNRIQEEPRIRKRTVKTKAGKELEYYYLYNLDWKGNPSWKYIGKDLSKLVNDEVIKLYNEKRQRSALPNDMYIQSIKHDIIIEKPPKENEFRYKVIGDNVWLKSLSDVEMFKAMVSKVRDEAIRDEAKKLTIIEVGSAMALVAADSLRVEVYGVASEANSQDGMWDNFVLLPQECRKRLGVGVKDFITLKNVDTGQELRLPVQKAAKELVSGSSKADIPTFIQLSRKNRERLGLDDFNKLADRQTPMYRERYGYVELSSGEAEGA